MENETPRQQQSYTERINPDAAAAAKLYTVYRQEQPDSTDTAVWRDVRSALRLNHRTIADAYTLLTEQER